MILSSLGAAQDEQNLKDALLKHTVVVRGYYTGSDLRFDENGQLLSPAPAGFGVADARIYVTDVQFKPDRLIITGQRTFPVYDEKSKQFRLKSVKEEMVTIEVALPPGQRAPPPELLEQIFLTGPELENKCTPEEQARFQELLSSRYDKPKQQPDRSEAQSLSDLPVYCFPTGEKTYRTGHGVHGPKPISTPDPEYSEAARQQKVEASLNVLMIVDEQGRPTTLYVTRPAGHGLDEQALRAVQQWRFRPAMFQGNPVPVAINVEISYRLR